MLLRAINRAQKNINEDFQEEGLIQVWDKINLSKRTMYIRYTAVVSLLMLLSLSMNFWLASSPKEQFTEYFTENGSTAIIKLLDGSAIYLKQNSTLRVPNDFTPTNRHVELIGEAYCEVFHDPSNPFELNSDEYRVDVLGTKFNIRNYPEEDFLTTSLMQGRVVAHFDVLTGIDANSVVLKVGQKTVYSKHTKQYCVGAFPSDMKLNYKKNKLIFEDTDLLSVFQALALYYNKKLIIDNTTIRNIKLNAKYINKSLEQTLESLKLIENFEYEINENDNVLVLR